MTTTHREKQRDTDTVKETLRVRPSLWTFPSHSFSRLAPPPHFNYRVSPIKDARLLKYYKSIFHIILPSLSSLSRPGIFLIFEKRASFLGNPVGEHMDADGDVNDAE